ncbi:MAG: hypothetical protein LBS69_03655 [Prevotellaceae bacterium]|jgi:hypothetical protein|nr:hypothetical protein [Prevotellaceae bacterium]
MMERNFVQYRDNDTIYDLDSYASHAAANSAGLFDMLRSFVVPVETAINDGLNIIGSWVNSYIGLGNQRRKDEQGYYLTSDSQQNQKTGEITFVIIIVLLIGGLIFLMNKKRKGEQK